MEIFLLRCCDEGKPDFFIGKNGRASESLMQQGIQRVVSMKTEMQKMKKSRSEESGFRGSP